MMNSSIWKRKTILLIISATLVRLLISVMIDLGNDEVYYRQFAQPLEWNYFDHPPMIGWLIRLTTFNLTLDYPIFIRLGAMVAAAATSWILYLCGSILKNERTGFFASALYTATIYGSIIAGTFILPDSPQVFFWVVALYAMIKMIKFGPEESYSKRMLLLFGVSVGMAMLCKVHSIFLWGGLGGYILFHDRRWLKMPQLYLSALISIIFFTPVIYWNFVHDFVTYRFHSNRVNDLSGGFNHNTLIQFLLGQYFYGSILLFPLFIKSVWRGIKKQKNHSLNSLTKALIWCTIPLMLAALYLACFNPVLPHWTGPAYLSLALLTAISLDETFELSEKTPGFIRWSLWLLLFIVFAGATLINFFPGTTGNHDHAKYGQGDATLDMFGWKQLGDKMEIIWKEDDRNNVMRNNSVVITNRWYPAGHLDFYVCKPNGRNLLAWGDTMDIHQYCWINPTRKQLKTGDDAYCITPSNNTLDVEQVYGHLFKSILPADTIALFRNGDTAKLVFVHRLKGYLSK
jgi:hypothetical protein